MNIDLGKKCDDIACSAPMTSDSKNRVYYPSLYLEGVSDLKDLPEAGEMTIKFKRSSLTVRERDGKKTVSAELEVRSITGINADAPDDEKSASAALDEIRASVDDDEEDGDDY